VVIDRDSAEEAGLLEEYTGALRDHLSKAGEDTLVHAYELGRRAMAEELGVLDIVELHHRALSRLLGDERGVTAAQALTSTKTFLGEALSPFEITHRGFREATEVMQRTVLFASVVCHELVTPLTSILVSAGMLDDVLNPDPSSPEGKLLANVLSAATTMKTRAEDLIEVVAFQSGFVTLDLVRLEPSDFLCHVCQRLEPEVTREAMELEVNVPDGLPWIEGDPDRLEQVVANLVRNAVKYGADGGRIEVRAGAPEGALEIEVEDNGPGIPPGDQLRVFQPYFRGHDLRHDVSGLGLGLMLCRQIVDAHGGLVSVENGKEDGTLFRVKLPLERRASAKERGLEGTRRRGRP
jgi:signal transduction histidine kinase